MAADPNQFEMTKKLINYSTPYILNGEFFEIISQEGENVTVRCCVCETRNIYKGSVKSTGNFHMHIKRKHPSLLPRVHELKLNSFLNRKSIPRKKAGWKLEHLTGLQDIMTTAGSQSITACSKLNPKNTSHNEEKDSDTSESVSIKQESAPATTTNDVNQNVTASNGQQSTQDIPCIQEIFEPDDSNDVSNSPVQVKDVLSQIESNLRGIVQEMRLRNQIETNRLFFEVARFKFLHPHFNFNMN